LLLSGFTQPSERPEFDEFYRSLLTFIGRYLSRQAAFFESRHPGDPRPIRLPAKNRKIDIPNRDA
jgi:hypothetical protein